MTCCICNHACSPCSDRCCARCGAVVATFRSGAARARGPPVPCRASAHTVPRPPSISIDRCLSPYTYVSSTLLHLKLKNGWMNALNISTTTNDRSRSTDHCWPLIGFLGCWLHWWWRGSPPAGRCRRRRPTTCVFVLCTAAIYSTWRT